MAVQTETQAPTRKLASKVIDTDVHPVVAGGYSDLFPYMPKAWREKLAALGRTDLAGAVAGRLQQPSNGAMPDAIPPGGGKPGSDPDFLKKDLLDRYDIEYGLAIAVEIARTAGAMTNPDQAAVVISALNDYFLERWADKRLRYALGVAPLDPELAVKEIHRHGKNPLVAAVYLPILNIRLGKRHYYPIYEAALEYGLPITTHPGAGENAFAGSAEFAVGIQEYYIERYSEWSQIPWSCTTSLIFSGTFDRYPDLRILYTEWGFSWAMPLMWRMDKAWREVRFEVPWVKKWPSEYVREHIRFSTQPIDEPHDPKHLDWLIENYFADTLMFATDYPHWDSDFPDKVLKTLSEETRQKVFYDNAKSVLRL